MSESEIKEGIGALPPAEQAEIPVWLMQKCIRPPLGNPRRLSRNCHGANRNTSPPRRSLFALKTNPILSHFLRIFAAKSTPEYYPLTRLVGADILDDTCGNLIMTYQENEPKE